MGCLQFAVIAAGLTRARASRLGGAAALPRGLVVVGPRAVVHVARLHAAVLKLDVLLDALAQCLVRHEHGAHVVNHFLRVERLHRVSPFALERQAEVAQPGERDRVSLEQLVGDEVGQQFERGLQFDGRQRGVLRGDAGHLLAAQRRGALRGGVPFFRRILLHGIAVSFY